MQDSAKEQIEGLYEELLASVKEYRFLHSRLPFEHPRVEVAKDRVREIKYKIISLSKKLRVSLETTTQQEKLKRYGYGIEVDDWNEVIRVFDHKPLYEYDDDGYIIDDDESILIVPFSHKTLESFVQALSIIEAWIDAKISRSETPEHYRNHNLDTENYSDELICPRYILRIIREKHFWEFIAIKKFNIDIDERQITFDSAIEAINYAKALVEKLKENGEVTSDDTVRFSASTQTRYNHDHDLYLMEDGSIIMLKDKGA